MHTHTHTSGSEGFFLPRSFQNRIGKVSRFTCPSNGMMALARSDFSFSESWEGPPLIPSKITASPFNGCPYETFTSSLGHGWWCWLSCWEIFEEGGVGWSRREPQDWNSHCFHMVRDSHTPIDKGSNIKGWMTIPLTRTLNPTTNSEPRRLKLASSPKNSPG